MNKQAIRDFSRKFTKTNATNYPDATLDVDIDVANGEIHAMIMEAEGQENFGGGFKKRDFTTSAGTSADELAYDGEFPIPEGSAKLSEVHLDYGDGFVKAEVINKSEMSSSLFEDDGQYSKTKPKVFIFRDSYFVRPMNDGATVTGGIKLITLDRAVTVGTDGPTWEPMFHQLLPLKVALDYFMVYPEKYNPRIDRKAMELEAQLISFYQSKSPIEQRFKTVKEKF